MTKSLKIQVVSLKLIDLFYKLRKLQIMGFWKFGIELMTRSSHDIFSWIMFCFSKQFCWITKWGWNSPSRSSLLDLDGFNEASYEVLQKFIKNARCQVFTQWNQSQTYKGCKISIDTVSNLEELSIF